MPGVAIQGLGVVGSFGSSPEEFLSAIGSPRVSERAATDRLEEFVARRDLRRIDHYSRLALLGAHLALRDAGMLGEALERVGVVIATGYGAAGTTFGFLDSIIENGDPCASPTHFSNSVHNAAAAHVSIFLKATGPSLTVSQFELSAASGLLTACQWLREGRVDAVLFGAVDEYCDVLGYCWNRYFGEPGAGEAPLDLERQSARPSEGAAFFVLKAAPAPQAPYGRIVDVELGVRRRGPLRLPGNAVVLLGADGHRRCGKAYRRLLNPDTCVAAYAPAYGSTPAAGAMDLAIAALAVRLGVLPPSPFAAESPWPVAGAGEPLAGRDLCCLKVGRQSSYSLITVRGASS